MIQRLHFEEAEASSYAINAARETRESQDGTDSESLALEFQALLAQISGQAAAVPDQAMAVGMALAETAVAQRAQHEERTTSDFQMDDSQMRDPGVALTKKETKSAAVSRDGGKVQDENDDEDTEINADSDSGQKHVTTQTCDENQETSGEPEQLIQELEVTDATTGPAVDNQANATVVEISEVVQGPTQVAIAMQQEVVEGPVVYTDAQVGVQENKDDQATVLAQLNTHANKGKEKDVDEDVELDPAVATVTGTTQREFDPASNTKRNVHNERQASGVSEGLQTTFNTDQQNGLRDVTTKQHSPNGHFEERGESQESLSSAQNEKTGDGLKAHKAQKEDVDTDLSEFISPPSTRSFEKASEGTIQMTILRQAFDALRAGRGEGADARAKNPAPTVTATTAPSDTKAAQAEQGGRGSKALTRPQTAKMLERVESALKEAARSRDGRTISLHLEPVNLGKVKVDVSLREGALHARIAPENQQVVNALRENAHELQGALRELGLDVESVTVSVTSEQFEGEMATGDQTLDGRSFQEERHKMPHQRAQVPENTVGNELAEKPSAGVDRQGTATGKVVDHWVA